MRIVIVLDGGLIQEFIVDEKSDFTSPIDVLICDYDTDCGDEEELMESPAGDRGFHHMLPCPEYEPGLVGAWFSRFDNWKRKKYAEHVGTRADEVSGDEPPTALDKTE